MLLPALLGAGIGLVYIYREEQKFNYASMRETARALAVALERDMARREAILHTLARSPSLNLGQLERFYGYASAVAKESDDAIILSDLEGRQLINTRRALGSPLPRMLPTERESRARFGNEATLVSDLYLPPAGLGPYSFAVQVPVRRDGKVLGFLTMASYASQMQNLLADEQLPRGWHASIVDGRGVVVARSQDAGKFVGRPVREELGRKIAAQAEGFHEGMTLAGVPGTAFFSRASGSGWVFLISVPHAALQGPATRATAVMAAISLLLLALGLGGALIVARRVARPVESLRTAAERLGHNEPVQAPGSGIVELDEVGHAMAQASERLRGATAELERRVAEAVARSEESQRALVQAQKLEALGRMTGGIAHDFNNVLQTLTAALHALKQGAPEDRRPELLASCQRAVSRGTELARQLMAFGRVQEARTETIDTAKRIADARQLLAGALPANIRLDYGLARDLWPVTVDPAQLELALLNLVINARDAMPRGGGMTLAGRNEAMATGPGDLPAGEYVILSLSDTGEGMSAEVMARAFDPFYTTKGVGRGSGMGLPQAYAFARQNGGTLKLQSSPGQGTTVTMFLPRAREAVSAAPPPRLPAAAAGKGKVLVVEDEQHVRDTVSSALRTAGFEIRTAETGDEALKRIEAGEQFDAVLTDVVMPGTLSGIDLAKLLRERHPRTGVVVVTGYSDRAVHVPGVRALAKPYDVHQAVEALNAAMTMEPR